MTTVSDFGKRMQAVRIDKVRLMQRVVHQVQGESQRVTPVLTGTLKRSETTRVEDGGNIGIVGTKVFYGRFVHEGTRRMKARPFFRHGMAASRDHIEKWLAEAGYRLFEDLR